MNIRNEINKPNLLFSNQCNWDPECRKVHQEMMYEAVQLEERDPVQLGGWGWLSSAAGTVSSAASSAASTVSSGVSSAASTVSSATTAAANTIAEVAAPVVQDVVKVAAPVVEVVDTFAQEAK